MVLFSKMWISPGLPCRWQACVCVPSTMWLQLLPFFVECSPFSENHLSWSSFLLPNVKKFLSFSFTVATSLFLLNGAPSLALNPPFHPPKTNPLHHPICYLFLHSLTFQKPASPIPFPCTFRFFFFLDLALIPSTYMLSLFFFFFTCQNHFGNFPYNRLQSSTNPCVLLLPF